MALGGIEGGDSRGGRRQIRRRSAKACGAAGIMAAALSKIFAGETRPSTRKLKASTSGGGRHAS